MQSISIAIGVTLPTQTNGSATGGKVEIDNEPESKEKHHDDGTDGWQEVQLRHRPDHNTRL